MAEGGSRWENASAAIAEGRAQLVVGAVALTVLVVLGAVLVSIARRPGPAALDTLAGLSPTVTPTPGLAVGPPGATSTPSTAPAPPPPTTTPPPAAVDLITDALDFGNAATELPLRFRNTGGKPLSWSVSSSSKVLTARPTSGALAPGATATVTATLDRAAAPEGPFTTGLRLVTGTPSVTDVPVSATVNHPPAVADLGTDLPWIVAVATGGCATARASATVTDDAPVTVTLWWGQAGGPASNSPMSSSGGAYSATIGPVPEGSAADVRWWVTATDEVGSTARSANQTLEVRASGPCPS